MRSDASGERNRPPTTAKKSSPAVKLEKYSGVTDLKTYLVKFDYMANYYGWTSDDRVFHLTTSLDGAAGQLLWELSQSPTEAEVRRLLNSRFGHSDQQERFRAELRTRCRRPGESIPALYTDIRRLLSLSYPGQSGDIYDTIGKDCFLDALGDSALRIRVLDQSPKTLEDALNVVCRMQAYSIGYPSSRTEGEHRQPVRQVAAETVQKRNEISMLTAPPLQTMMDARWKAEVEQTIANLRRELQQARADTAAVTSQSPIAQFGPPTTPSWMQSKPAPSTFVGHPNIPHQPATWQSSSSAPTSSTSDQLPSHVARDASRRGGYGRPHGRTADRRCWRCGDPSHFSRQCPDRQPESPATDMDNEYPAKQISGNTVPNHFSAEVYLPIFIDGKKHPVLVDTGCEKSACGKCQLSPDVEIRQSDVKLFAANSSSISVTGITTLAYRINNVDFTMDILVSEDLSEIIFGCDWLIERQAFVAVHLGVVWLDKTTAKLMRKPARANVRRIYAYEPVSVAANSEQNVRVRLLRPNRQPPQGDWLTQPTELKPGLFMARSLLPGNADFTAVHVVNISDVDQVIDSNLFLGNAYPGILNAPLSEPVSLLPHSRLSTTRGCEQGFRSRALSGTVVHGDFDLNQFSHLPPEGATVPCKVFFDSPPGTHIVNRIEGSTVLDDTRTISGGSLLQPNSNEACSSDLQAVADISELSNCIDIDNLQPSYFDSRSLSELEDIINNGELSFLKPMLDSLPVELSEYERHLALAVIVKNADIVSKSEFDIGLTHLMTHTIDTGSARPIYQRLRSHPQVYEDLIDKTIAEMERAGIIAECSSPWASNLVLVRRPNNPTPKVTVDLRALNEVTVKDRFPLPRIADCLHALSGSLWFSAVDLSSSFHQISLDAASQDKTSFLTKRGQFKFLRMAMGQSNGPSSFCRLLSLTLRGLDPSVALSYVDDITIMGRSASAHAFNVDQVLGRFRQAGLKVKAKKCQMFQKEIKFLGFLVTGEGFRLCPDRVASILAWQPCKNVTQMRSFLSSTGFCRAFVKSYSSLARPLVELLKKMFLGVGMLKDRLLSRL